MTGRIRRAWGLPFAVLSAAAFGLGVLFHQQALRAAASEAARQELGSCCHPAEESPTKAAAESRSKETLAKVALSLGVLLLGAAVVPAALAKDETGPDAG